MKTIGKIKKILDLCLKINNNTDLAAFYDFAGHVESICISIGKNKVIYYNDLIYYKNIYIFSIKELNKIIKDLNKILERNKQ